MTRSEAKAAGVRIYYGGRPCLKGHAEGRYTGHGSCVVCAAIHSASDHKKAYDRKYQVENKDRIAKRTAAYLQRTMPERLRKMKEWADRNKDKVKAIKTAYKHRRRTVERAGISGPELQAWESAHKKVCYWCDKPCARNYHIDHYEPLSKGGKHEASNLVIACAKCNQTKSAKDPYQFAQQQCGRLF